MIINEKIRIRINKSNLEHYKLLGYKTRIGEGIEVYPIELMPTSKALVCVGCDNCRTREFIEYRKILTRKYNNGYYCKICKKSINDIIFREFTKTINHITESNSIYTIDGWKNIQEITISDNLYVYDGDKLTISDIKSLTVKENTEYYNIKSKYINFNFIKNHKFLVKDRYDKTEIKDFIDLNNKNYLFSTSPIIDINDRSNFILNDYIIPMRLWCKFIGIFLSNGFIEENNRIIIKIDDDLINDIIKELPFIYKEYQNGIIIFDNILHNYLSNMDSISSEIKESNVENIKLLIEYLYLSNEKFYTKSENIKNDIELLFYKIGSSCNINRQQSSWVISESNKVGRYLDKRYLSVSKVNKNILSYYIETSIDGYILIKSNNNCVFYSI